MGKRVPPSPEAVGECVRTFISTINGPTWMGGLRKPTSADGKLPRFVAQEQAVRHIRHEFGTTLKVAEEWLYDAVAAGAVRMLNASVSGRHLSEIKLNTLGSEHRFMQDTPEGMSRDGGSQTGILSVNGILHLINTWKEPAPNLEAAPEDSRWVLTPELLHQYVKVAVDFSNACTAELSAEQTVKKADVEIFAGEGVSYVAGLLELAGVDVSRFSAIEPRRNSKGEMILEVRIDGLDAINAVAEVLKKAGVPPTDKWKEF